MPGLRRPPVARHLCRSTPPHALLLCLALSASACMGRVIVHDDAVEYVSTGEQLRHALEQGKEHIVVLAHLDLTSWAAHGPVPVVVPRTTRSIRGSCADPASTRVQWKRQQCVLKVPYPWVTTAPAGGPAEHTLWLSTLYLETSPAPHVYTPAAEEEAALVRAKDARLYMTAMTLVGGEQPSKGVYVSNAHAFVADAVFTRFTAVDLGAAAHVGYGSVSFQRCSFHGNSASGAGAVLAARAGGISLSLCSFHANTAEGSHDVCIAHGAAEVYSDVGMDVYQLDTQAPAPSRPLALAGDSVYDFLYPDDPAFISVVEDQAIRTGMIPAQVVPRDRLFARDNMPWFRSTAAIAALATGTSIIIITVLLGSVFCWRRGGTVGITTALKQHGLEFSGSIAPSGAMSSKKGAKLPRATSAGTDSSSVTDTSNSVLANPYSRGPPLGIAPAHFAAPPSHSAAPAEGSPPLYIYTRSGTLCPCHEVHSADGSQEDAQLTIAATQSDSHTALSQGVVACGSEAGGGGVGSAAAAALLTQQQHAQSNQAMQVPTQAPVLKQHWRSVAGIAD